MYLLKAIYKRKPSSYQIRATLGRGQVLLVDDGGKGSEGRDGLVGRDLVAGSVDAQPVEVVVELELAVLLAVDVVVLDGRVGKVRSADGVGGLEVADPVADPI